MNKVIEFKINIPASVSKIKVNVDLSDAADLYVQHTPDEVVAEIDTPEYVQQELKLDDNALTVSEHVYLREAAYDERINMLKAEMANKQPDSRATYQLPAVELHPDVHNLPHNIIDVDQQANSVLPDVEETQ